MNFLEKGFSNPSERVLKLKNEIFGAEPKIEIERAKLITESFKTTENEHILIRKAEALKYMLENLPVVIRDGELIVGSLTITPRSAQVFPEFSTKWLENEFDTLEKRTSDAFSISEEDKKELKEIFKYWEGKTVSELATSYMSDETKKAMAADVFTVSNYHYNGLGHISIDYKKILEKGFNGLIDEVNIKISETDENKAENLKKIVFWKSIIISLEGAKIFIKRYARLAKEMANKEKDENRKIELLKIVEVCENISENKAKTFYEACQLFWFTQAIISLESNGHAISPSRFDQYMVKYLKDDIEENDLSVEGAREILQCLWIKFNDPNKIRDAVTTKAFSGYSMFQNLIVGGQNSEGKDATNILTYMCLDATGSLKTPQPSLSVRVWSKSPEEFLIRACEVARTGVGLPAFYNDEVIIPMLVNNGITLEDAREYGIVGCVEPQVPAKTDGWYDAAFFNLARVLELTLNNGLSNGIQYGPKTGKFEAFNNVEELIEAYKKQTEYFVAKMVAADNCVDIAHSERAPLPFLSCFLDDCISKGLSIQNGGGHYKFSGPLGVGVANVGDSLMALKTLIFDEKKITKEELIEALRTNFGEGENIKDKKDRYEEIRYVLINKADKYGNDVDEVDELTREGALIYCKEVMTHFNQRGGRFVPGLYPVSNNVHLGELVGATPDGRLKGTTLADGVSPSRGFDVNGPTAACNSVAKLDHFSAPSGTLFNQKFNTGSLKGDEGLKNLSSIIRGYFDQKGMHMQFNVVDREILIKAQEHPEEYRDLIVRVAGYSAQFVCLDRGVQDDIIKRTEQRM